jgi:ADP-ribose pyrophosphatase
MAYRVIDKQVLYTGRKLRFEVHHLEDDLGHQLSKEVVVHPGAVVILALLDEERIVLIRNRRHAVGQVLVELPAGTLEKGEMPMNAAGRELLEETGYLARRLKPLLSFYPSPGVLSEKMYVFTAHDLLPGRQDLAAGEEIDVVPTRLAEAITMIRTGEIQDGKTIATLLAYDRFFRNPPTPAG